MAMRVLLLRHAESADPGVFHGAESDVGLSERGRRQAEAVAPLLAALEPARLVSSAMRRARDTAQPIAQATGLEIQIEPALHERRVGALSGTPTHGSDGVWPDTLARWVSGDTGYAPIGAESYDDLRSRLLPVWHRLTASHETGPLVVVAHGIVCKVLLLNLLPGHSPADWHRLGPIANVGISELIGSGDAWTAVRVNAVAPEVACVSA
jgi:2,3-bisphosphoglycerate-dependent phosphoglycerate mutase